MKQLINIFLGVLCSLTITAQTPIKIKQVIQHLSDTTLETEFTLTIEENISQPNIYMGHLRMRGEHFDIDLQELRVTYDGNTLYWLDKITHELTLSHPTTTELRDANPLMYMTFLADNSKESVLTDKTTTTIILLPSDTTSSIIKYTLCMNNTTSLPVSVTVREPRGKSTSLTFKNIHYVPDTVPFTITTPEKSDVYINDLR